MRRLLGIARWIFAPAFYAAYAVYRVGRGLIAAGREVAWARRLASGTVRCPSCGRENSLYGRWVCACSFQYHGTAVECPACGARAAHISCECGISIPIGGPR